MNDQEDRPDPFLSALLSWAEHKAREQVAAEEQIAREERLARGNANWHTLPLYNPVQFCRKCGADMAVWARLSLCTGGVEAGGQVSIFKMFPVVNLVCRPIAGEYEHIHQTCGRCGDLTYHRPLDSQE